MKVDLLNVAIGFDDHTIVISSRTTTIPNFLTNTKVYNRWKTKNYIPFKSEKDYKEETGLSLKVRLKEFEKALCKN